MSTISHLGVCGVGGGGVAVGGRGLLGLGCLRGLSVGAGLLLSLRRGVQGRHGDQSVTLVLLVRWVGLLSLQVQRRFTVTKDNLMSRMVSEDRANTWLELLIQHTCTCIVYDITKGLVRTASDWLFMRNNKLIPLDSSSLWLAVAIQPSLVCR